MEQYSANDLIRLIRMLCAGLAAAATYLFGGADKWLFGLLIVVIIDYVSGVIAAVITCTLSSRIGFIGILKKVLLFCVVAVAHIIDEATGAGGVLRALTIGFLLANESISVLENCGRCGVPLRNGRSDILPCCAYRHSRSSGARRPPGGNSRPGP